jgi:hypothetical protein
MKPYDELEDCEDDFDVWAGVHEMIRRDSKRQLTEDLEGVGLTWDDFRQLLDEWDKILEQAGNLDKKIL